MASWRRRLHQAACLVATAAVSGLAFSDVADGWAEPYCLLLPVTWAALAFDLRTTVATLAIIVYAAAIGSNPYARGIDGPLKRDLVLVLALLTAGAFGLTLAGIEAARRREHAALVRLTGELEARIAAAVAEREAAVTEAKRLKRLQALAQVAGGVAHEFNNLLQTVVGAFEMIARHPEDIINVLHMADLALGAAERGGVITRRLLGFAHRAPLHAVPTDIAALLTALCSPFSTILGAPVTLILQPDLPRLLIDKDDLEIALAALVSNARDAMPGGGTLTVSAATAEIGAAGHPRATLGAGRYLCIAISDTGTGMDAALLARASDPFFTTKPPGQGTGLGLSMVAGFAEQSGGGLVIESVLGAGTTVTLWLPAPA